MCETVCEVSSDTESSHLCKKIKFEVKVSEKKFGKRAADSVFLGLPLLYFFVFYVKQQLFFTIAEGLPLMQTTVHSVLNL